MAVSLDISIKQNSQSIANNTSNVTVTITCSWTGGSFNWNDAYGYLEIDGEIYDFYESFNGSGTTSGSKTLHTETVDVKHDSDGKKTLECYAYYETGTSSGNISASETKTLSTIARKSTLSASSGSLGEEQTLTITRAHWSFTHTITYECGELTGTIVEKTSGTSVTWTPPLSLAEANTTGASVTATLTLTTYSGITKVGTHSIDVFYNIGSEFAPTFTVDFSDDTGYKDIYGDYLELKSRLKIKVNPTTYYGATVKSCKIVVSGETFTDLEAIASAIDAHGDIQVYVCVWDSRNKLSQKYFYVHFRQYSVPIVSSLTVKRCDSNGTENDQGEYIQVKYSANATSLDNLNTASYKLEYKKSTDAQYTTVKRTEYNNQFYVSDTYIFVADTGSSYNVRVTVTDNFGSGTRTTTVSTASTLMNWLASGLGMAIGKVAELANVFDIEFKTRFLGGILHPVLENGTNLDDIQTPNTYISGNSCDYLNCPCECTNFTLLVEGCGEEGYLRQTFISGNRLKPEKYSRLNYVNNSSQFTWGEWMWTNTDEYVLYENDGGSNGTITLWGDLSDFRYIEIYFTDNNGKSGGYTKVYSPDGKTLCLHIVESSSAVYNRQTLYTASGRKLTPKTDTASYFVVSTDNEVNVPYNLINIVRVVGRA